MTFSKRINGVVYKFEVVTADDFTVTPHLSKDEASPVVWQAIVRPNIRIKPSRPKRRGGLRG